MALAETAELAVRLSLDDKLSPAIGRIDKRLSGLGSTIKRGLGVGIATGAAVAGAGLVALFKQGTDSLKALQVATAQTEAVIKSTGAVAGITAEQVGKLAEKYENLNATIDDKVIRSAENLLLTFTNIREDAFEPTLAAVLDFAQATGTDATSAAKLLGRALNDPIRGMTFLRRAGVSLDAQTEKRIKQLTKQGDLFGAQKILLDELAKRYGGSFARAGDTAAGSQARLEDKIEDLSRAFATSLLPVVEKVTDRLADWLSKPGTVAFFRDLGDAISSIFTDQNLDAAASALQTAAGAVKTAIGLFNKLPPEVKALAIGAFAINKVTGGAVGGIAGALGKVIGAGLSKIFAAHVTVIGGSVTGGGGISAPAGAGAGAAGAGTAGLVLAAGSVGAIGLAVTEGMVRGIPAIAAGIWGVQPDPDPIDVANTGEIAMKMNAALTPNLQPIRTATNKVSAAVNSASNLAFRASEREQSAIAFGFNRLVVQEQGVKERITHQETRLANLQERLHAAREAHETGRAARLRDRIEAVRGRISDSNAKLERIARKKTQFRINNNIGVSTYVSVRDIDRSSGYRTRVARSTSLAAQ